jgi:hypothetical protein
MSASISEARYILRAAGPSPKVTTKGYIKGHCLLWRLGYISYKRVVTNIPLVFLYIIQLNFLKRLRIIKQPKGREAAALFLQQKK